MTLWNEGAHWDRHAGAVHSLERRQNLGDANRHVRKLRQCDFSRLAQRPHLAVAVALRLSVDDQLAVLEIEHPVVRNVHLRVQPSLQTEILGARRIRDLDDEMGRLRSLVEIVARFQNGDVGFGLGQIGRGNGTLNLDLGAIAQGPLEEPIEPSNRVRVGVPLRTHRDDLPLQELQPLVLECAQVHEAVVLGAPQQADRANLHIFPVQ